MPGTINHEALWEEAQDLGDDLVDAGSDPDAVAKAVAEFLDAVVPLNLLVPGLPGMALEMGDGPLFEQVVGWFARVLKGDPARRAERRQRRESKREARRQRRAARRG